MKRILMLILLLALGWYAVRCTAAAEDAYPCWEITLEDGTLLTHMAEEPAEGDQYISSDNRLYEIVSVSGSTALARQTGEVTLPDVTWLDLDDARAVSALTRRIALYCTHSDESYEPTDGYYSTDGRGTIYDVAQTLADALAEDGTEVILADDLHHPHDAGAYRRSRQTAVRLLKETAPDCLLDIHRDGIPDPASYAVTLGGEEASKVRILVGRGNANAEANKEFALLVKAVADRVYPGLIKDIYMGRGVFNQDLLPRSILLECGTYTLEKERVLRSMDMMADVLTRALYGGVRGSAGTVSDAGSPAQEPGGVTMGQPDFTPAAEESSGAGKGILWAVGVLAAGLIGYAILSAGSLRGGMRKAGRNLSEMTGGLIGKKPEDGEDPQHSGKSS